MYLLQLIHYTISSHTIAMRTLWYVVTTLRVQLRRRGQQFTGLSQGFDESNFVWFQH